METLNYRDPEPPRDTQWRSHREITGATFTRIPPLHYDERRGGWTVFGRHPVPQWGELPESSFPLIQV